MKCIECIVYLAIFLAVCKSVTEAARSSGNKVVKTKELRTSSLRRTHASDCKVKPQRNTEQISWHSGNHLLPVVCQDSDIIATTSNVVENAPSSNLRYSIFSLLVPWLYFMCVSINIPTLPKYINYVINNGDFRSSETSATVYGNVSGLDSLFTFLSVNLVGVLSDRFGRKPFMFFSSAGIGLAFFLISRAKCPRDFYISACLDGFTSCMLSQSQAYITDNQLDGSNISIALSRFQGIAIGMAFMFGIPLGGIISSKVSVFAPFYVAMGICLVNCILIATVLPDAPKQCASSSKSAVPAADGKATTRKTINWRAANPLGAATMMMRTKPLLIGSTAYFLINIAHSGLQVVWINFLENKFNLSAQVSGSTLMVVGFIVALVPPIVIPRIGVVAAFKYGLLLYTASLMYLGAAPNIFAIFAGMPFLAAGAAAMPILLGHLTEQVTMSILTLSLLAWIFLFLLLLVPIYVLSNCSICYSSHCLHIILIFRRETYSLLHEPSPKLMSAYQYQ